MHQEYFIDWTQQNLCSSVLLKVVPLLQLLKFCQEQQAEKLMRDSKEGAVSESICGQLLLSALQAQISEADQLYFWNQKNWVWLWDTAQSAFSVLPGLFESHNCEGNSSDKFSSLRMQNSGTSGKAVKANNEIESNAVAASCILDFITPL